MVRYNMNTARQNFTDLVNRAAYGKERIIIGRRDEDLAVLVPIEDAQLLERLEDEIDLREARLAEKEPGPNISLAEVKRRIAKRKAKA
jgi:prevent-host-death family protein